MAGLSRERTEVAAWTVTTSPDGVVGGARAVAAMLTVAWNSTLPMLPWRIPKVPMLLDRLYELVARNRHRLPGETPWCVAHPDECEQLGDS